MDKDLTCTNCSAKTSALVGGYCVSCFNGKSVIHSMEIGAGNVTRCGIEVKQIVVDNAPMYNPKFEIRDRSKVNCSKCKELWD